MSEVVGLVKSVVDLAKEITEAIQKKDAVTALNKAAEMERKAQGADALTRHYKEKADNLQNLLQQEQMEKQSLSQKNSELQARVAQLEEDKSALIAAIEKGEVK